MNTELDRLDTLNKTATDAIGNAAKMAQEMEDRFQYQLDDACRMVERLREENETLKKHLEADKSLNDAKGAMSDVLEEENEELTSALKDAYERMDFMELGLTQLREEANCARRDFTGLQLAVSILIFVYGIIYGKYSCM